MDFCIGDRVRLIDVSGINTSLHHGDTGEIVGFYKEGIAQVRWDKRLRGGHDCQGNCEYGYGWNVKLDKIEILQGSISVDVSDYL